MGERTGCRITEPETESLPGEGGGEGHGDAGRGAAAHAARAGVHQGLVAEHVPHQDLCYNSV